jgi:hypothetical protein
MMDQQQERMQQLLRRTMQSITGQADAGLRHDLWPAMLKRLEARRATVPWFDWALLAAVAVWLLLFPGAIPLLFYYL